MAEAENSVAARRRIARAMLEKATSTAPIQSPWQGAANLVNAGFAGWEEGRLDREEREGKAANDAAVKSLFGGASPSPTAAVAQAMAGVDPKPADISAAPADLLPRFAQAEAQYGLPKNFLAQTAKIESSFNPSAKNPNSSAAGLFQFTRGTARDYGLANPLDPIASTDAAARLAADNKATLARALGRDPSAGELYLAHQQGGGGASKLLANPNARAVDIVGRDAVMLNGGREDMTAAEFARRWTQKVAMGGDPDMPAPDAMTASKETGRMGFAVPGQPQPMDGRTFDAITGGNAPLEPAFQSEGVSQPWMGSAMKASPAVSQVAAALTGRQPPPRPADLPAPGAVEAVGRMPQPAQPVMPDLSNESGAGARELQVMSEQARQGQPQPAGNPLAAIAAAMTGQSAPAQPQAAPAAPQGMPAATTGPAPAQTASSAAPASADRTAAAMSVLNSPYATPGQRMVAQAIVQQSFKDPAETQMRQLQMRKLERDLAGDPLDREAKQLEIEAKRRAAGETKAPTTKAIKQADGSEVVVQWDAAKGEFVPLKAPQGGAAVGGSPSNPYALPGKPTEGQGNAAGYANRMVEGHNIINQLEDVGTSKMEAAKAAVPFISNNIISADKQKLLQAQRNFLTAILRKESGAVISDSEFDSGAKQYFPVPGDTPETIAQKRINRETAIQGVMGAAGTGYKVPETYKPGQAPKKAGDAPAGVDPKVWQFMTPEERALWN